MTSVRNRMGFSTALPPECSKLQEKFKATLDELAEGLIERDDEIALCLTALVAGENPLLVGPPGTGKSLLLDSLLGWVGGQKFTLLLSKFTTPEEVFGPVSLAGLKADKYVRVTTGKLPTAELAFLDEIFKASSAILNTMLRILNERVYDNGDGTLVKVPLKLAVAASNEWPSEQEGGRELGALFDRFVLRKTVRPIASEEGREKLLWVRDHTPKLSTSLSPVELEQARKEARGLPWAEEGKDALRSVLRELRREGITPGDRRQFKAVGVAQAFAYIRGEAEVGPESLEILQHVLWDVPEEQPQKAAQVILRVANPVGMKVNSLLLECESVLASFDPRGSLPHAAAISAKLGEIEKQLAHLKPDDKVKKAQAYLRDQIKRVKLSQLESL